jgi:EAL domain-containing protein (putative c-di-GMP-specific phosphodiesterase class I)
LRDLDSALRSKKLELHYQPKFDMHGEVRGFEALARWPHPTRGMIPPDTFIRLAEENGLILQLGEWAMEEACKEAAKWDEHLTVAVNVSPVQFRFGDLPATVQSILERTGLAPERLELEITEGVLIHDIKRATVILWRLRVLGVQIALDDFGVGYSSLSYLHSLPFNKIKLDRSLMREATATSRSGVVVASVIDLCHKLGMTVLAEGIEEDRQLDFLREAHCDEVQGFLLGRPKPISAYARTVGEKSSSATQPHVA